MRVQSIQSQLTFSPFFMTSTDQQEFMHCGILTSWCKTSIYIYFVAKKCDNIINHISISVITFVSETDVSCHICCQLWYTPPCTMCMDYPLGITQNKATYQVWVDLSNPHVIINTHIHSAWRSYMRMCQCEEV